MKITVKGSERNINLHIPTGMVFNRGSARIANFFARKYAGEAMENIPSDAMEQILEELLHIKKKHGSWELVHIESASGEKISIIL